ncbi:MAG: dTDP-4-amino-4,6-dideoxygalactose transaminase [candidate division WOR-3 bacterium]
MGKHKIPFNQPGILGRELEYVRKAIEENKYTGGDGFYGKKCEELLENILDVSKVLLTTSCTHALEIAAILLQIKPGDEVILPSFTFVSTANAFLLRGAKPVFVDIRPDTLNLDEKKLEFLITERTKVIVPVHYGGVGCEMDLICKLARKYSIYIVEDNAHGFLGKYKGRFLGSFGTFGALSFHETKNFSCGEGGALIINDKKFIERAEIVREKGTDRAKFFRGEVDKYTWKDIGSSYVLSDILAAFLFGQLEKRKFIQEKRKQIWNFYKENLSDWAISNGVKIPFVPSYCDQSYHLFYILLPSYEIRNKLISHLKKNGILSVFHYQPLHLSPMGRRFGYRKGDLPVTEDVSDRLLRLPFYNTMEIWELREVCKAISEFRI